MKPTQRKCFKWFTESEGELQHWIVNEQGKPEQLPLEQWRLIAQSDRDLIKEWIAERN